MTTIRMVFDCAGCGREEDAIFNIIPDDNYVGDGVFDGQGVCGSCGAEYCGSCMDEMEYKNKILDLPGAICVTCLGKLHAE